MSLLERFLFAINFPYTRRMAYNVPGAPELYRRHLDALLHNERWNCLHVQDPPAASQTGSGTCEEEDHITAHVSVTRSFRHEKLALFINVSHHSRARTDAIETVSRLLPHGWELDESESDPDQLTFLGRTIDAGDLPRFIDRVYREVYQRPEGYQVDIIAQATPHAVKR